jgi:hypothetical protein
MKLFNPAAMTMLVTLLAGTQVAQANSWICEHGTLVREIKVERASNAPAPCQVVYNKDSEGQGSSVLWSAENDGAYCDAKADGLADKLKGYGWTCSGF